MGIDKVFATEKERVTPFKFDEEVASVFDDMIGRSVPFYQEILSLTCDITNRYYQSKGHIFDLGCSTGTTFNVIDKTLNSKNDRKFSYIGIDNSTPMIEMAKNKCQHISNCTFKVEDILEVDLLQAEVVILNYTLQFLKVDQRPKLLKTIYDSLLPGGVIIISEKIYSHHAPMQELITDLYYDFKRRNGYSELEISQKREALENVLIPLTPSDQVKFLEDSGFKGAEMLFRWYNFASFLGVKPQ